MCGTSNKVESVFCAKCNSRLVPLIVAPEENKPQPPAPPIKGLSLPAKPAESIEEPAVPTQEPPAEESATTDWISQLRANAPSDEDESTVPASSEVEQLAEQVNAGEHETEDWMARLRSTTTEPAPEPEPEDIPDWLKPAAPADEPVIENAKPDWLEPVTPPAPVDESAPIDAPAIPSWLKEEKATEPPPAPPQPVESLPAEPDWLKKPAVEQATDISEAEIPDWLKEFKPTEEASTGEPLIEALEETTAETKSQVQSTYDQRAPITPEVEDIPDWLRTPEPTTPEPVIEASLEELQPALPENVPDWIAALKPAPAAAPVAEEPVETAGPLAGLRGVLPLALAIAEPHTPPKSTPSAMHKEAADLFASILSAPAVPTTTPAKKPGRVWTMRPFIYLLLALAVLIPFFIPFDLAGSSLRTLGTPTEKFYETIQALPANSTIAIAFDYDPGAAWEMDLQARALLRHLVQKNIKVVALSTVDTGAVIAQRDLNDAVGNASNYVYGINYVNLGYLPGNEAGLASLADRGFAVFARDLVNNQEISKLPATASLKTLRDTQLVIVLTSSEDALKAWMEQVQPRAGVKIAAGVSAAVEPKARAYQSANQLAALMSGAIGAAQYEILSGQPGQAVVSLNAQTPVQILFVAIIVLGNLVYWTQRARGAQQTNG